MNKAPTLSRGSDKYTDDNNGVQQSEERPLLTGLEDAVDELLARDLAVVVAVLLAEEVHHTRLVVVHPAHVAASPLVKVKVFHALQLRMTVTHMGGVA